MENRYIYIKLYTMSKFVLTLLLLITGTKGIAQCPPGYEAQLNALKDSCASFYNQKSLLPFIEKFKGKEVWLINNVGENRIAKLSKRSKDSKQNIFWFHASGTCKESWSSGMMESFNNFKGINCILHDIQLLPNLQCNIRWNPEKGSYFNIFRANNFEYDTESFIGDRLFRNNDFKTNSGDLMFKYYAIFTVNPDKTYFTRSGNIDSTNVIMADTLYIPYNDNLYYYIKCNDDFQTLMKKHQNWEQEQWDKYNRMEAARYDYAKQQWGEHIADKIKRGLLEFGFSSEMCVQARREEPYNIDKAMTPFGIATRYDFYQEGVKLYFIDDKLIGIQTKQKSPLYYM